MNNIYIYLGFIALALVTCKSEPNKLRFIPIKIHFYNDTIDASISQSYIVKNFSGIESDFKKLDSFFCKTMDKEFENRSSICMIFYKESKYTNLSEIEKYDHIIDQYSTEHDKIYKLQIYKNDLEVSRYMTFDGVEREIGSYKCN